MPLSPRNLRPSSAFTPKSLPGLALWLDASDAASTYTTDAGPVAAVSSPLDISGCVLWLDGADSSAASMTLNGSLVETWKDKSGSGNNVTASGGLRPTLTSNALNSRSVLTFGGSQGLTGNLTASISTNAYSAFVVCRISGSVTNGRVLSTAGAGSDFSSGSVIPCVSNSGTLSAFAGTQGTNASGVTGFASYGVFAGVLSSNLVTNSAGGMSVASAAATLSTAVTRLGVGVAAQGGTGFNTCDIAEIILYPTALSTADRARVEAYLATKWGISAVHTQAIASNPVGYWADKSGNGRHATQATAGNRPRINSSLINNRRVVEFPNNALNLQNQLNISGALTTTNDIEMIVVARKIGLFGGSGGYGSLLRASSNNAAGPWLAVDNGKVVMYGGSQGSQLAASAVPTSAFISHGSMIGGGTELRINGALVDSDSLTGTPAIAAAVSRIGPYYNEGGGPLYADVAEVLAYARSLTTSERQRLERYLAAKWGITLAPQVSNLDAQDWVHRVYANGGTVTPSTAAAVNTFCNAIDAAGIRSRFFRLNPYCGTLGSSIQSSGVVVPLYRGIAAGTGGNFLTRSTTRDGGSFSSAVWETIGSSPVPTKNGDVASPNGSPTATSVTYGATSGYSALRWSSNYAGGWTANATGTFSVWARKPVTGGAASIRLTTNNAAGWNTGVSQKFALTTEWQRLSVTGNLSTGVDMFALIGTGDASGGIDTDCIGTVELWRPQVEVGSTATAWQACQYGNPTDTQNGFSTGNYSEADGLLGAPGRYLATGLSPDTVGVSTGHVSIWAKADTASSAALAIGSRNSDASQRYEISTANRNAFQGGGITDFYATQAWGGTIGQAYQTTGSAARPGGMYLATRTSGTRIDFYLNASSVANSTASVTPGANSNQFYVQAQNSNGTATFTGATTCRGYSIGLSLDSTQVASLYSAWSALQTALGRS